MIEYESLYNTNLPFLESYQSEFRQLLNTGWFVLGENVKQFEKEFAHYHQLNSFVGVASGLDALLFSLILSDLPQNSEVLVPANTYIATILAIIRAGLKPILVEPDINTYNIDPKKIESSITKNTRALIIVHLYGKPCEMEPILKLTKSYNLKLIEDCAQAHGASYQKKKVGTFGDFAAFSFYPTKNLGALGDAGGLALQDLALENNAKMIRNYGSSAKYKFDIVGYNSRLDEVQACFLRIKLKFLDQINKKKQSLAGIYFNELNKNFVVPIVDQDSEHVFHIFNIRHPDRDRLREYLLDKGIKTEIHYPIAPHQQEALNEIVSGHYPVSEEIHKTTLSLPISWAHKEEEIQFIAKTLNNF